LIGERQLDESSVHFHAVRSKKVLEGLSKGFHEGISVHTDGSSCLRQQISEPFLFPPQERTGHVFPNTVSLLEGFFQSKHEMKKPLCNKSAI
jgi:hypothetical protein